MILVDAHEDIAWSSLTFGRDYTLPAAVLRQREAGSGAPVHNGEALLGWPDWQLGEVAIVFASLFAAPIRRQDGPWDILCYRDDEQARRLYWQQLDFYHHWVEKHPDKFRLIQNQDDLGQVLAGWEHEDAGQRRLGLVLMMEGAEGLRTVEELEEWVARGLRIVAPCWAGTRYAGGTGEPGPLTRHGRALLTLMADLGLMLDLSHMDEEAVLEALDHYPGLVLASHTNPAALGYSTYDNRHLSDEAIRRLAERGGVLGIVPYNCFLRGGWTRGDPRLPLGDVVTHIDHVCQLVGDAAHVGLGSDFDGGFGLDCIPAGLDSIADLRFIGGALTGYGFSQEQVEAVLGGNWLRLLRKALPET